MEKIDYIKLTDNELITILQQGPISSKDEWLLIVEILFDKHKSELLNILKDYGLKLDSAENIAHNYYNKIIEKIYKFDNSKPFTPWLKRCFRNKCIDSTRSKEDNRLSVEANTKGGDSLNYIHDYTIDESDQYDHNIDAPYYNQANKEIEKLLDQPISKLCWKELKSKNEKFYNILSLFWDPNEEGYKDRQDQFVGVKYPKKGYERCYIYDIHGNRYITYNKIDPYYEGENEKTSYGEEDNDGDNRLKYKEIAEQLHLNINTVKTHLRRAKALYHKICTRIEQERKEQIAKILKKYDISY